MLDGHRTGWRNTTAQLRRNLGRASLRSNRPAVTVWIVSINSLRSEKAQGDAYGEAIDTFMGERHSELLDLLVDLIAIDSQIPPHADERAIVEFLQSAMTRYGLPPGEILAKSPERPNLIVRIRGEGAGPNLMLNGHVDTKPIGEARAQWRSDPFRAHIEDGLVYGLGSNDMKAGVAAMVFAAHALRSLGIQLSGDLLLGFVADEEAGAHYGSRFVAPTLTGVDAVLIGEPSGWERDWQGLHLVSRGISCFTIRVTGTQRHSSLSDRLPSVNATTRMAGLLSRIVPELAVPHTPHPMGDIGPTLNAGVMISGGTYFGVMAGSAEFSCDLRTVPGMTLDDVKTSVEAWLQHCRDEDDDLVVDVEYDQVLDWVPCSEIDSAHPLVRATQDSSAEVLGAPAPLGVFPGGTDSPWYDAAGIPAIPSFGPGILASAHGPNEFVSISSLVEAARMYARIAIRYCGLAQSVEGQRV